MSITNNNIHSLVTQLKANLAAFPEEMQTLEQILEASAKHLPSYLKIVKSHIEQLTKVLGTDNHHNRKIEAISLADPVKQLMNIFQIMQDNDLEVLENLARTAKNWELASVNNITNTTTDYITAMQAKNPSTVI